jgi:RNA polymerase sigma-70 factor (ECF subfamily)
MNLQLTMQRSLTLTHSDTSLIARCQQADIAAFNEIVARYKGKIYNYLYRMTGNAEDAEDLTQEVFVRMYTNIRSFRAESSLSTWLFRIAGNLCVDSFRRRKKERGLVHSLDAPIAGGDDDSGATRDVPDWTHEPDSLLSQKELGAHIQGALAKLPPKLRSAVVLHDVEGMAYEEIAQLEQIPLGTVKSRIFNARVALRENLRPYLEA